MSRGACTQDGHRGRELKDVLQRELTGPILLQSPPPERGHQKPGERAALLPRGCSRPSSRGPQAVRERRAGASRAPDLGHPAGPTPALPLPYPRAAQQPLHGLGQQLEAVEARDAAEHGEAGRVRGRRLRARQRAAALVAAAPQVAAAHLRAPAPAQRRAAKRPLGMHLRAWQCFPAPRWRAHASQQRVEKDLALCLFHASVTHGTARAGVTRRTPRAQPRGAGSAPACTSGSAGPAFGTRARAGAPRPAAAPRSRPGRSRGRSWRTPTCAPACTARVGCPEPPEGPAACSHAASEHMRVHDLPQVLPGRDCWRACACLCAHSAADAHARAAHGRLRLSCSHCVHLLTPAWQGGLLSAGAT